MKKIWIIVLTSIITTISINAQQRTANISFRKVDYDFKSIKETGGPVSVVFSFINTGGVPLSVQNVTASCGCTTPNYTKSPVMPGDSGFVKVTYNPDGRPGSFTKEITVISTATNSPVVLKITGSVIPRAAKVEDEFRYTMGTLKLSTTHLGYGKLLLGNISSMKLKLLNSGNDNITFGFANPPSWIKVKSNKIVLKPKEIIELDIEYNTTKRNDYGFLLDYVMVNINGKQDPANKITITAEISEDFSKLTPTQKANAPVIQFENTTYNFGSVTEGNLVEYNYPFINTGKSDLKIRKLTNTCGCVTATASSQNIKPGEKGIIKVVFNTKGYKTSQTKTIAVVSNDPNASQITLWLKGIIQ